MFYVPISDDECLVFSSKDARDRYCRWDWIDRIISSVGGCLAVARKGGIKRSAPKPKPKPKPENP